MKFQTSLASLSLLALHARATPAKRADAPTDIQVLNYALTLEHLENNFYSEGLKKFDDKTFSDAGFDRNLFKQIGDHEATHVKFLSTALGDNATQACTYNFPYTDVKSFSGIAQVLEGVGVTAYLGAAKFIMNKDYLTAAGAILTTEARHASWLAGAENGVQPWTGAFDTPLTLNDVFSLAAPFIVSCPSTNPPLPVKAFPALTVSGTATQGQSLSITPANASAVPNNGPVYAAFLSGLTTTIVPYNWDNKSVTVPPQLETGTVYVVLTSQANGTVSDDTTLAGPAIVTVGDVRVAKPGGASNAASSNSKASTTPSSQNGAMGNSVPIVAGSALFVGLATMLVL